MTALTIRTEERRNAQADRLRAQGHATDRPGDRLHRYFAGKAQDGDIAYHQGLLGAIEAHHGDVLAIAGGIGIGERTLRRWMKVFPCIRQTIKVAALKERLRVEEARL